MHYNYNYTCRVLMTKMLCRKILKPVRASITLCVNSNLNDQDALLKYFQTSESQNISNWKGQCSCWSFLIVNAPQTVQTTKAQFHLIYRCWISKVSSKLWIYFIKYWIGLTLLLHIKGKGLFRISMKMEQCEHTGNIFIFRKLFQELEACV